MKKILSLLSFALFLSPPAFAIDQVVLSNGEVVQGKILSDVPNRHVDVQLMNGEKRRYPRAEVSSVDRDIPSNRDSEMYGNDSRAFGGFALGMFKAENQNVTFAYGARFGVNTAQLGNFSKFAFGLGFYRSGQDVGAISYSRNELLVQLLFRRIANSGFYFGPEFGIAFVSAEIAAGSTTANQFEYGGLAGYDYHFNQGFSVGPEAQLTSYTGNNSQVWWKALMNFTVHFE